MSENTPSQAQLSRFEFGGFVKIERTSDVNFRVVFGGAGSDTFEVQLIGFDPEMLSEQRAMEYVKSRFEKALAVFFLDSIKTFRERQ
jgi:hypothetical protein